jgi:8-oxo-dGTP pyrophosphatase MutT (NUDIX family)
VLDVHPEPVVPKPAATVLLLRDDPRPPPGRTPLQVFLQRRVAAMAFAGGMTVFPGGGVDAGDRPDPALWAGPDPQWWAGRLGCAPAEAGALVQAAVRETFEECGVLLAGPAPVDGDALTSVRAELAARRTTLGAVLGRAGLVLRADLLLPWARWITPEAEPRRYDTAFFVARVPAGQEADAHTSEAVEARWWYPAEALEHEARGDVRLMPPTLHTLRELAALPDTAAALAAARDRVVRPVRPVVRQEDGRTVVVVPDEPGLTFAADHLRLAHRESS